LSQKADKNLFKRAVSRMRKDELIAVMMAPAYKDRFHHIKMNEKGAGKPKKQPRYPAVEKAKEEMATPKKRRVARPSTPVFDVPDSAPTPIKSKKKPKKKKNVKLTIVDKEEPLTATKADGTVIELKKRVRKRKPPKRLS